MLDLKSISKAINTVYDTNKNVVLRHTSISSRNKLPKKCTEEFFYICNSASIRGDLYTCLTFRVFAGLMYYALYVKRYDVSIIVFDDVFVPGSLLL